MILVKVVLVSTIAKMAVIRSGNRVVVILAVVLLKVALILSALLYKCKCCKRGRLKLSRVKVLNLVMVGLRLSIRRLKKLLKCVVLRRVKTVLCCYVIVCL